MDTRFNGCKQRKRCMVQGKNNCQQTWKRDQRILRTISLYAATSAAQQQQQQRSSSGTKRKAQRVLPGRVSLAIELSLHSVCVCEAKRVCESCHIYGLALPSAAAAALQLAPSPSLSHADQLRRQGKIQLGVACAAFGASKIIALCFCTLRFSLPSLHSGLGAGSWGCEG